MCYSGDPGVLEDDEAPDIAHAVEDDHEHGEEEDPHKLTGDLVLPIRG